MREETSERLEAEWKARSPQTLKCYDADLQEVDAAYRVADNEFQALALALAATPSTTLEGALAKTRVLPDHDDLEEAALEMVLRLIEGTDLYKAIREAMHRVGGYFLL